MLQINHQTMALCHDQLNCKSNHLVNNLIKGGDLTNSEKAPLTILICHGMDPTLLWLF